MKPDRFYPLDVKWRPKLLVARAILSPEIATLRPEAAVAIVNTIAVFDDFSRANGRFKPHDFGAFDLDDGRTIFFEIEYVDKSLTGPSPNPSDPAVTERVITIMLPAEWRKEQRMTAGR
jgi:Protein of unknown function (DUF3768)